MYAKRKPREEPPCITCRIDSLPENKDALRIFFIMRTQLIMGPSGPIDLNHLAIDAAMLRERIEGRKCFNQVLDLGQWWIDRISEKE